MNSTIDYLNLFLNYYNMEGMDLPDVLKWYFDNYQPCFSISRYESPFLYAFLLQVKCFIVSHGVEEVLPRWVSLTCLPALFCFRRNFMDSGEPVACDFTIWSFACIWALLWQIPVNMAGGNWKFIRKLSYVIAILDLLLDGYWFALDAFVVIIGVWYLARSLLRKHFYIVLAALSCGVHYTIISHGSPNINWIFNIIFVSLILFYFYRVDRNGDREERDFFFSIFTGLVVVLCYYLAMYGVAVLDHSPTVGRELQPKLIIDDIPHYRSTPGYDDPSSNSLHKDFVVQEVDKIRKYISFHDPKKDENVLRQFDAKLNSMQFSTEGVPDDHQAFRKIASEAHGPSVLTEAPEPEIEFLILRRDPGSIRQDESDTSD